MTKSKALTNFFNSFGIPAYPSQRVPDDVEFPYMTYEQGIGFNGMETNPRVVLWYFGTSELEINKKAEEIMKAIGECEPIRSDDGTMYVYFNEPWQALNDEADKNILGRYTNLKIIFNTK